MIRRVSDFIGILLFVWTCLMLGLWIISSVIVPLELPVFSDTIVTGIFKVAISALLVLLWLWVWREVVKRVFWRAIRKQKHSIIPTDDKGSRREDQ